ncbi:ImmA/IrrE family metallo-endopeptidase [Nitrosovibrio tenuis]|uniref:IrrE N-terminal-like domain-containing protein n=1 Tax=Nitrosovibrio tenuis TaxID=1233 RepID=A0A1H7RZV7_9PROT|nr:ImmA/IrrE family metallo-endopeptidase [Nitrosovibrio tenuis]SEL65569.1 protein of unknown function [Nitrosovibrio tenuis]
MEKVRAAHVTAKALKTRRTFLGIDPHLPMCPYALCDAMGFDLRFVKIPSFEGMYIANQNLILISAERPEGRKRFTCGHEIGHHVLQHGTVIDEILECGSNKQEEEEADLFASMLLMPSSAVNRTLLRYGIATDNISSADAYTLSKYFGVSYQAFITHIYINLRLITYKHYQKLKASNLSEIRRSITGLEIKSQVFNVGHWWDEKAIELEVGDYIVFPTTFSIDGPQIFEQVSNSQKIIYKAIAPGITRIFSKDWSCFSKISRYKFQGIYQYKYDEEE